MRTSRVEAGLEGRVVGVALLATVSALLAAFTIYQWRNWSSDRQELADDAVALARAVSGATHAAAVRADTQAAADASMLLAGAKHITDTVYFAESGARFGIGQDLALPPPRPTGGREVEVIYRTPGVEVHVPRYEQGRRVGEVVVRASDHDLIAGRIRNILMALALSAAATLAAGLMARRMTRQALAPLKHLNAEVEALTASRDFRRRATVASDDEVGQLTRNYNRMVDALERYDGELRRALGDITAARDAAEEANIQKSQFLANMGHEVRTPLNGVLGMAQALMMEDLTPLQRERVDVIRKSGSALLCILNDLLDLSQMETGDLALERAAFEIETVVEDACAVAFTLAESKGIAFEVAIDPQAAGRWEGDPARVRQVLYNLVSNALKFTAKGHVTVAVAVDATRSGVLLSVIDTGLGVAPELADRLFGTFVQGEAGATRRFGGAGLGLAVCRNLVELMGGEIELESVQGEGSTFRVFLPLRRADGAAEAEDQAEFDLAALRVLVAEDNETNQQVVRTVLNAFGVDPVMVADGRAAVEAWNREAFDLVLMDIQMPVRDGVSATVDIRRLERELGRVRTRIVALTANALPQQVAEYAAAGMDGVVSKPIMVDKLHAALAGAAPALRAA